MTDSSGAGFGRPRPLGMVDDLYRLLVETVRDYAIFALDTEGRILTWNRGAERLKGYTGGEIIGQHFSTFYPPDDLAWGKPAFELKEAIAHGRLEDEGWRVRKDGSRFWANVIITALRDDDGTLIGFAKVTRDLTERRRTEEELRRSEERFRLLIESVLDYGIITLDLDGIVISWNEGATRINGYPASEIMGRHFSVFYSPEDIAAGQPETELRVAAAEGRFEDEGWRIRKDGSRFWANVVVTALRDPTGRLIGFAKITRDLTERRAMNERLLADARRIATEEAARVAAEDRNRELGELLAQLQTQAQELDRQRSAAQMANRAKSEFLAAMSHELRTPLNAIGGYIDLLSMGIRGPVTSDQVLDLERMRRSQQHLLGIINDLLNYARIEAGQVTYQMADVPLADVVATAAEMAVPLAAARKISFVATDVAAGLTAYADRAKLDQILINIVSNAVKFTNAGGRISITARADGDRVVVEVTDTGIGIPADMLETIFEPFVQVGRTLTNPGEGTGLGLAISRDLARAMGGDLSVRSRIGVGSTFTVTLARVHPEP